MMGIASKVCLIAQPKRKASRPTPCWRISGAEERASPCECRALARRRFGVPVAAFEPH